MYEEKLTMRGYLTPVPVGNLLCTEAYALGPRNLFAIVPCGAKEGAAGLHAKLTQPPASGKSINPGCQSSLFPRVVAQYCRLGARQFPMNGTAPKSVTCSHRLARVAHIDSGPS